MKDLETIKEELGYSNVIIKTKEWEEIAESYKNSAVSEIADNVERERDNLYNSIPSGQMDAWDLLKVIQSHISNLDELHESIISLRTKYVNKHKFYKLVDNQNKYTEFTLGDEYRCIHIDNGVYYLINDELNETGLVLRNIDEDFELIVK